MFIKKMFIVIVVDGDKLCNQFIVCKWKFLKKSCDKIIFTSTKKKTEFQIATFFSTKQNYKFEI